MVPTLGQKAAGVIFGLALVFCGLEMVPAWGGGRLAWSPETFYTIMAVVGALSGFLLAPENRVPGLAGGLLAGPGALFAVALVLANTTWTHSIILVIAGALGVVPGCLLFAGLKAIQDSFSQSEEPDEAS